MPLTKARRTFLELRSRILDGRIAAGTRLTLRPTAKELGVGMNAVGEALRALAHEGLVELEPKVGARVRARDLSDVRSEFVLRLAVECEAARQVAARAQAGADGARWLKVLDVLAAKADALARAGEDLEATREADIQFHLAVARFSGAPTLEQQLVVLAPRLVILDPEIMPAAEFPATSHARLVEAMREGEAAAAEAMREHVLDAMHWAMGAGLAHP